MAPIDMASLFEDYSNFAVLSFFLLFLVLLAQNFLCIITYNQNELLDIREVVYDFPELDPLFVSSKAI